MLIGSQLSTRRGAAMSSTPFPIAPITPDEGYALERTVARAFGMTLDDKTAAHHAGLHRREATLAARDDGRVVGTTEYYDFSMSVPHATPVPCAGVTGVAVLPTHRRRGVLASLMRRQLDDLHERGTAWAALYASEAGIYGRFGYGMASRSLDYAIGRPWAAFERPPGPATVDALDTDEALERLQAVYETARRARPGMMSVSDALWRHLVRWDPEESRHGAGERQVAAIGDRAYALYRLRQHWDDTGPDYTLNVETCVAVDAEANRQMWAFLFGIDLVRRINARQLPVDDPLPWWLVDRRRLRISEGEPCHIRLVDVGAALSQRGTRAVGSVVLDVGDAFCPWNTRRWRLEGDGSTLRCAPDDATADVALDARTLASLSLGGIPATQLANAGLIDEQTSGAVTRLDALLASHRPPWNAFTF